MAGISVNAADMVCDKKGKVSLKVYADADGTLLDAKEYSLTLRIGDAEVKNNRPDLGGAESIKAFIELKSRGINYKEGTIVKEVTIYSSRAGAKDLSSAKINIYADPNDTKPSKQLRFSGEKVIPGRAEVNLKGNSVAAAGYEIRYYNNLLSGKAVAVAFGKGEYAGAAKGSFKIK